MRKSLHHERFKNPHEHTRKGIDPAIFDDAYLYYNPDVRNNALALMPMTSPSIVQEHFTLSFHNKKNGGRLLVAGAQTLRPSDLARRALEGDKPSFTWHLYWKIMSRDFTMRQARDYLEAKYPDAVKYRNFYRELEKDKSSNGTFQAFFYLESREQDLNVKQNCALLFHLATANKDDFETVLFVAASLEGIALDPNRLLDERHFALGLAARVWNLKTCKKNAFKERVAALFRISYQHVSAIAILLTDMVIQPESYLIYWQRLHDLITKDSSLNGTIRLTNTKEEIHADIKIASLQILKIMNGQHPDFRDGFTSLLEAYIWTVGTSKKTMDINEASIAVCKGLRYFESEMCKALDLKQQTLADYYRFAAHDYIRQFSKMCPIYPYAYPEISHTIGQYALHLELLEDAYLNLSYAQHKYLDTEKLLCEVGELALSEHLRISRQTVMAKTRASQSPRTIETLNNTVTLAKNAFKRAVIGRHYLGFLKLAEAAQAQLKQALEPQKERQCIDEMYTQLVYAFERAFDQKITKACHQVLLETNNQQKRYKPNPEHQKKIAQNKVRLTELELDYKICSIIKEQIERPGKAEDREEHIPYVVNAPILAIRSLINSALYYTGNDPGLSLLVEKSKSAQPLALLAVAKIYAKNPDKSLIEQLWKKTNIDTLLHYYLLLMHIKSYESQIRGVITDFFKSMKTFYPLPENKLQESLTDLVRTVDQEKALHANIFYSIIMYEEEKLNNFCYCYPRSFLAVCDAIFDREACSKEQHAMLLRIRKFYEMKDNEETIKLINNSTQLDQETDAHRKLMKQARHLNLLAICHVIHELAPSPANSHLDESLKSWLVKATSLSALNNLFSERFAPNYRQYSLMVFNTIINQQKNYTPNNKCVSLATVLLSVMTQDFNRLSSAHLTNPFDILFYLHSTQKTMVTEQENEDQQTLHQEIAFIREAITSLLMKTPRASSIVQSDLLMRNPIPETERTSPSKLDALYPDAPQPEPVSNLSALRQRSLSITIQRHRSTTLRISPIALGGLSPTSEHSETIRASSLPETGSGDLIPERMGHKF